MNSNLITLSIVSHGQFNLVQDLLKDLENYCKNSPLEILLTLNIPENIPENLPVIIINNHSPKGFGANHNAAFQKASGDYFCVLNPDIKLIGNPFPDLIKNLQSNNIGITGPLIIDKNNIIQDNAREFLTPLKLLKRLFIKKTILDTHYPDWIAGMFMLFKKEIYKNIGGFDERYFLYCEDMDICKRLKNKHLKIYLDKNTRVIHAAQRTSHKKLKYLYWHIESLLRYFITHVK